MKNIIVLNIKNRRVFFGKDKNYNTIIIDKNKLQDKKYKQELLNKIEKLEKQPTRINYNKKRKYFSDSINHKTRGEYTSRIEVKIIQENEKQFRIINELKTILK